MFTKQPRAESVVCKEGVKVHSLLHIYKTNFTIAVHAGNGVFFLFF